MKAPYSCCRILFLLKTLKAYVREQSLLRDGGGQIWQTKHDCNCATLLIDVSFYDTPHQQSARVGKCLKVEFGVVGDFKAITLKVLSVFVTLLITRCCDFATK